MGHTRLFRLFIAALLCQFSLAVHSFAQDDPLALQQQAIKRIDAYLDFVRKTGDFKTKIPELAQADNELTQSNGIFETRKDWPALALGLIKQGSIFRLQNQYPKAITLYKKAEEVAKLAQNGVRQAEALSFIALTELNTMNYGPALVDAKEAVRIAEITGDMKLLENALGNLSSAQIDVRDFDGAAETVNREIEAAKKAKEPMALYMAYHNRSSVFLGIAEQCDNKPVYEACYQALDLVIADLNQASAIAEKLGYTFLVQLTKDQIDYGEARRKLYKLVEQKMSPLVKKDIWHPKTPRDVVITKQFISTTQLDQKYKSNMEQFNRPLKEELKEQRKKAGGFYTINARTYSLEGQFKQMEGENEAALAFFIKAVDALEHERYALHDEQSRGTYLEDKTGIYYQAILQLLEQHRYPEAFDLFERARSRALADLLASRKLGLVSPEEQKLYGDMMSLRARIATAQGRIFELANGPDAAKHAKDIEKLQREIDSCETDHGKVLARMGRESPRLKNLAVSEPANLQTLQQSMREEGYEVLQYMVQGHAVILWHITSDSIFVCNVFFPQAQVAEKVDALRKSVESRDPKVTFDETTAKELFLFLIQPVLERIKSKRLVIIPHEELNSIPFQLFLNPADGRFLGERFQISYAPSASILLSLKRSSSLSGGRLLAVADPDIPFAVKEVKDLAELFPEQRKVETERHPRECDVKTWARDYDIVHLSVHGKFNEGAPMLSYLKLGEGGGDDGKLTAAEMYGLPLDKSRLVVLSACETGKSQATHGNEILGMTRGLLFAGANSLLLSNWRVDSEATALWMQTFYENALTRPLPEAAQAALVRVKGDPRYAHPRYWAAFTLIGR